MFITNSHNCTWSFIPCTHRTHACLYASAPLYQNSLPRWLYISCGETLWNTPQNDDVTRGKKTTTHLTIWHSVCIIFLFHIFSTFFSFSISLFIIFSCSYFTLACNVGGKEDEFVLIETLNVQYMKRDDIIVKLCIHILYGVRSYGLYCTVVGVSIRHSCACVFMFR